MQKLPKEERRALRATNKSSSYLDEKSSLPAVNLQVDRVLGCRIQGLIKTSLCSALSDDLCSDNLQANDQRDTNAEIVVAEDRTESSSETGKSSRGSRLKDKDMDESALGTEGMVEVKEVMLSEDNLPGDPSAGPSERPGTSTYIPNEKPFPLNSLGVGNLGSLGLDTLNSLSTLRADEKRDAIKHGKLPLFLDMPLPPMLDSSNSVFLGRSANTSFLNPNLGLNLSNPMGIDILGISSSEKLPHWFRDVVTVPTVKSPEPPTLPPTVPMGIYILGISSSENKLPHWLRDVVTVPTVKSPEPPTLSQTVSAIAQSVRVLYGEDSTTISPFVIPDPPPHAPRDPRHSLRKKRKRKLHSSSQKTTDIGSSSHNAVESSSQGHLQTSSTPHLPPPSLAGETSGSSQPNLPPHNLNSTEPLSSAVAIRFPPPEEDSVIAAAPSEAHGPSLEGITGTTKSISLN